MNTYIFYIMYEDDSTDEFKVVAPNRTMAMEIVANEYEINFDEVAHICIEVKKEEDEDFVAFIKRDGWKEIK